MFSALMEYGVRAIGMKRARETMGKAASYEAALWLITVKSYSTQNLAGLFTGSKIFRMVAVSAVAVCKAAKDTGLL